MTRTQHSDDPRTSVEWLSRLLPVASRSPPRSPSTGATPPAAECVAGRLTRCPEPRLHRLRRLGFALPQPPAVQPRRSSESSSRGRHGSLRRNGAFSWETFRARWVTLISPESKKKSKKTGLERSRSCVNCRRPLSSLRALKPLVEILSEGSSLSPGKRLHHQRSSRHAMVPLSDTSPHPEGGKASARR
jgi:hypothetical protein